MRVRDIIKAQKTKINWGEPKQGGMTMAIFPLSRRKKQSLKFGNLHKWRLVKFEALGEAFRLLIVYHTLIENFEAYLGLDVAQETKLIATYSYHGTHPGWHMHAGCGDIRALPAGMFQLRWLRRLPDAQSFVRKTEYVADGQMNDTMGLAHSRRTFQFA
jgi:hypothetical protein